MLATIVTGLAKHTLTLWVTLVPVEINTINGENSSPGVRLVLDREEKNGHMILWKGSNWNEKGAWGGATQERKWPVMAQQPPSPAFPENGWGNIMVPGRETTMYFYLSGISCKFSYHPRDLISSKESVQGDLISDQVVLLRGPQVQRTGWDSGVGTTQIT